MEIPLLADVVVLLSLSVIIILVFHYLKLPGILGLLLTGIIAGPHGLSLIDAVHEVEVLAEIGVVLLLFVIGLEFSLQNLLTIKRVVLVAGSVQVFGTILVALCVFFLLGYPVNQAVFLGFLFALSSTAIVLKLLQEKGEIYAPHGKITLGILIYQDIIVVLFMLLTPILAGNGGNVAEALLLMAGKVVMVVVALILIARYIVPELLYRVAKTKSKELFVLTTVVLCFSIAWLTSSAGLSLALGAFMAGLAISESEYGHQATSNILPFRELFTSFFFVSIGMLLDVSFLIENLPYILLFTLAVAVLKAIIAALAAYVLRYPPRTVILVGLSLFQVGEFAFILSAVGISNNLLSDNLYQYFLSISIATMAITPFVFKYSEQIMNLLLKTPLPLPIKKGILNNGWQENSETEPQDIIKDHLIIVGYGLNGRNVALAAKQAKIPYRVIEMNPDTVRTERANGEPIFFGDAGSAEMLHHLHVENARVVVVAISDPVATKSAIVAIREITDVPHIIIRTRFLHEIEENLKLGANDVIPEEFETSIEIFNRVLNKYLVPQAEIDQFTDHIRQRNYEMFRSTNNMGTDLQQLNIPDLNIVCIKVKGDNNDVVGHKIADAEIRQKYGVSIVAIITNDSYDTQIKPDTEIHKGDTLYVLGKQEDINVFNNILKQ